MEELIGKFEAADRYMSHKSNSSNLDQDIKLAMEVKKYPCLYDRRDHGYKRNDPSMESWASVAKVCDWIPNAEEACRLFEVLKKRYSKKKMDYRRANYFANSPEMMKKTKEELDKYQFMNWMEPHIRHRTVKLEKEPGDQDVYDADEEIDVNVVEMHDMVLANGVTRTGEIGKRKYVSLNEHGQISNNYPILLRNEREDNEESEKDETYVVVSATDAMTSKATAIDPCHRNTNCVSSFVDERRVIENGNNGSKKLCKQTPVDFGKSSSWKVNYSNYSPMHSYHDYYESTASNGSNQHKGAVYKGKVLKDEDELFAEMILNEIRKLEGKEKCVAKHEIVNILFSAQLKQFDAKKSDEYSRPQN